IGDEYRRRRGHVGKLGHAWLVTVGTALRLVEFLEVRRMHLGDEPEPVPCGPFRGGRAAARNHDKRTICGSTGRGDVNAATVVDDGLALEKTQKQPQVLVRQAPALPGVD